MNLLKKKKNTDLDLNVLAQLEMGMGAGIISIYILAIPGIAHGPAAPAAPRKLLEVLSLLSLTESYSVFAQDQERNGLVAHEKL